MAQIQQLPSDVAAQVKASANLCSLNNVVVGLLENALDASTRRVHIKVDYARASCWIQDDGIGITASSFAEDGGLAEPFHTSKTHRAANLLGPNGLFLASVAAVSVLTITSKSRSSSEANTIIWRYAQSATRLLPAPQHMSLDLEDHGTKVSVHDLFGNMPVRVKQRPSTEEDRRLRDREWHSLCVAVTGCVLAYGELLHLTMRGKDSHHVLNIKISQPTGNNHKSLSRMNARLSLARSVLQQAFPSVAAANWVSISARTSTLHFQAIVSSDAIPQRYLQFVCIDDRYMPADGACEMLYESVNQVFSNSSFGKVDSEDQVTRVSTKQQQQAYRPSLKHWPAFIMLIKSSTPETIDSNNQRGFFARLSEVATTLMTSFLADHGYQTRKATPTRKGAYAARREPTIESVALNKTTIAARELQDPSTKRGFSYGQPFRDIEFDVKLSMDQAMPKDAILKDDAVFRSRFISSRNGARPEIQSNQSVSITSKNVYTTKTSPIWLDSKKPAMNILHDEAEKLDCLSIYGKVGLREPQVYGSESDRDEVFEWLDPKTRKISCINVRTGSIVKPRDNQRPGTTNDSISQLAQSRSMHCNLPRITRSADGIAPLKDDTWAKRFLENWHNPVLENMQTANSVSQFHFDDIVPSVPVEDDGSLFSHILGGQSLPAELRLQRSGLRNAVIISQVDSKFILTKMCGSTRTKSEDMIVLVDQHAADERIRVEQLLDQLCSAPSEEVAAYVSPLQQRSAIDTIILQQPVVLEVQNQEYDLFRRNASYFAQWGILFDITPPSSVSVTKTSHKSCQLTILSLPSAIAQRCSTEPRLLLNVLRSEIWKEEEQAPTRQHQLDSTTTSWVTKLYNCPTGILDLINSRACRSAVMFNDVLTLSECRKIVSGLANCQFPFQCAHGRPSMVPLLEINETESITTTTRTDEADDFSEAWKTWTGRE